MEIDCMSCRGGGRGKQKIEPIVCIEADRRVSTRKTSQVRSSEKEKKHARHVERDQGDGMCVGIVLLWKWMETRGDFDLRPPLARENQGGAYKYRGVFLRANGAISLVQFGMEGWCPPKVPSFFNLRAQMCYTCRIQIIPGG